MYYLLAFLGGCAFTVISFVAAFMAEYYLASRQKSPIQKVAQTIKTAVAAKGFVIQPKSQEIIDFEDMIARNDEKGIDTPLGGVI